MKKHFTTQKMSPTKIVLSFVFLLCFTMPLSAGMFTMKNVQLGKYVNNYSVSWKLLPIKNGVNDYEVFIQESAGGGYYYIKCPVNNKYVTVDATNTLVASVTTPGNNEKFLWVAQGAYWAIKSYKNNKYVSANTISPNYPLQATKTTVTNWEKFTLTAVVDFWKALTAFGSQHPNMIKFHSQSAYPYIWPGNTITKVNADINTGGRHYLYWVIPDFRFDENGLPGYDRNDEEVVSDWAYWTCRETIQVYNSSNSPGAPDMLWWVPNILRTKQYGNPDIVEYTARRATTVYKLDAACNNSIILGYNNYGGKRHAAVMRDYTNTNSAINPGWRWVVDIELTSDAAPTGNGEYWTLDLGPAVGVFDPEFGMIEYGHPGCLEIYNNYQNKDGHVNWQNVWYTNYPMPCDR
jgi:hypothetical protein